MEYDNVKVPRWYWLLAVFFLLWNIMGVMSFYMHTFVTDEYLASLSEPERALYDEYPLWVVIAFAVAVFGGLLGSVGLVLRKKWSRKMFIVSLCAIIPQMAHNLFFTSAIEVYGATQAATMPVLVVVIGVFLVWFSKFATEKGWMKK